VRLLAVLVLGLLLSPQDSKVQDLLAKLDDDSIEVRAAAAAALTDMGKAALPALKSALAAARGEIKDRLAEIVRKIHDRDRLAVLLPPASRITINAKDLPVREVFEKVMKQSRTAIDYSQVPEEARVTVSLDRVPFWKAIEEICKASGAAMPDVQNDRLVILPEPYVALPGKITDLFRVTLERIDLSTSVEFGQQQDRYEQFTALFRVSWEKGARPCRILSHIAELVDEQGNEIVIAGDEGDPMMLATLSPDVITQEFALDARGPGPTATKISKLKIEVEFEFPLKYAEVKVDLTGNKNPATGECPEYAVRLGAFTRQEGGVAGSLVLVPHGVLEGEVQSDSVRLKDKAGHEYSGHVTVGSPTNENETAFQIAFQGVPDNAELAEFIIRIPTEVHRERLEIDLKDVPLK
jgi:hypothetical protein